MPSRARDSDVEDPLVTSVVEDVHAAVERHAEHFDAASGRSHAAHHVPALHRLLPEKTLGHVSAYIKLSVFRNTLPTAARTRMAGIASSMLQLDEPLAL
jgi:hypothetical protein